MSGRNSRRIGLALVLASVLALTLAQPGAATHRSTRAASAPHTGLFESVWNSLAGWWAGQGLKPLWGEEGPGMDPNGKAQAAGPGACDAAVCTDMGPGMDPNGLAARRSIRRCGATACADMGPEMDPDGAH